MIIILYFSIFILIKMDLALTPDIYTPIVNEDGNYIDKVPVIKNRITCPCGARRDKIYENSSKFSNHIKTKKHQEWLKILNDNKVNYYVEKIKNEEIIQNQQKIIKKLENDIEKKILTIDYLTKQLSINNNKETINLIDF